MGADGGRSGLGLGSEGWPAGRKGHRGRRGCGGGGRAEVFEMLFRKEGRKEPQARSPGCVARGLQSSGEPAAAPTARLTHSASPGEDPTRASFPPEAGRSLGRETRRALHARSSQCDRVLERQS